MTTSDGKATVLTGSHAPGVGHQLARQQIGVMTASGNITLTLQYRNTQRIDPGGASRSVTLPAESGADGAWFEIWHTGDDSAELLTVQDDTPTTVEVLGRGERCLFRCDGSSWYSMGVIASTDTRLREAKVTITTTQVLNLHSTPITLVAAPGANKYLEFCGATIWYDYNDAAYGSIAGGDDLEIRYTDGSGAEVASQELTGFVDQTNDELRHLPAAATPVATPTDIVPVANAVLVAFLSGQIDTGTSPLIITTYYRVHDFTP